MVQLNRQYDRASNSGEAIHVKVVGVGGAGSNILDRVMLDGIESAELVAINTDVQSLTASVAAHKVQLGRNLTRGLGSGGDPELGYAAAEESTDDVRSVLQGGTVVFLCAGLGGGTGSGAARLRAVCDAVVCFENDRMAEITLPRMGIHEAFAAADLTVSQSIRSVASLLQRPGLLHIGFDDVCAVLRNGDARALFGYGEADGENRAHDALAKALKNPLMNRGALLENAFHAIVHICGGANITLGEVQIIMEELNRHINDQTQLFMGIGIETRMGNRLSVSILSSLGNGLGKPIAQFRQRTVYPVEPVPQPDVKPEPWKPAAVSEPPPKAAVQEQAGAMGCAPERTDEELMLPRTQSETHKPAQTRPAAKLDSKPQSATAKKIEAKQETLQFEPVSRGRFEKSEPTIIDGQDLDIPTFLRKNLRIR
jgi:cell division protein FtsZ